MGAYSSQHSAEMVPGQFTIILVSTKVAQEGINMAYVPVPWRNARVIAVVKSKIEPLGVK